MATLARRVLVYALCSGVGSPDPDGRGRFATERASSSTGLDHSCDAVLDVGRRRRLFWVRGRVNLHEFDLWLAVAPLALFAPATILRERRPLPTVLGEQGILPNKPHHEWDIVAELAGGVCGWHSWARLLVRARVQLGLQLAT